MQSLNFVVFGVLALVFAAGLHRSIAPSRGGLAGPALIGVSAVAAFVAAAVPRASGRRRDDVLPDGPHGRRVHVLLDRRRLVARALAPARQGPQWSGLATYTAVAGAVALVGFFVMGALVMPDDAPLHEYAGVGQRTLILVVFSCRVTLAVRMLRLASR